MSKLKELQDLIKKLPVSPYAGDIAGNSTVSTYTGNFQGNWISKGYCIRDSMNVIFAGSYEQVKQAIENEMEHDEIIKALS